MKGGRLDAARPSDKQPQITADRLPVPTFRGPEHD
jgi:hypothetical protein